MTKELDNDALEAADRVLTEQVNKNELDIELILKTYLANTHHQPTKRGNDD